MKLKEDNILGYFDGITSQINVGKNMSKGMVIYTRFHEDAHRIFQTFSEIGWIIYFLKKDCEVAAENNNFKYCNRFTAFVNILENFMENISEIVANTCELLAVNENGIDVEDYIENNKKKEYKKYCFLFDYINSMEGGFYDKTNFLFDAAFKTMQEYDMNRVRIGLEEGIAKLKEKLLVCEAPEIRLQRILYGEVEFEKKEFKIKDILNTLERLGALVYIKDFVTVIKNEYFEKIVDELNENKEFLNLAFHKNMRYFEWDKIKCKNVSKEFFLTQDTQLLVVFSTLKEECIAYKYNLEKSEIIRCQLDIEDLKTIFPTVKYVMYEKGKNDKIDSLLKLQENLILVRFYEKIDEYFKSIIMLGEKGKFMSVSDSHFYAVSFGMLVNELKNREIHFSIFNGLYSRILYEMVEQLGGKTYYRDDMSRMFENKEVLFAFSFTMLFCLEATM